MEPLELDYYRLDRLALKFRDGISGMQSGKRLTSKYGSSLEFADYRPYLPGDDPRRIDWLLFGRSRRLYTRLNRSEVDATVNFLVDNSKSMNWGEPDKGRRALELVLALSYLSLRALDRIAIGFGAKELESYLPPLHGKGAFPRVLHFLQSRSFSGEGDLNLLLLSFHRNLRPQQMAVVVSDFLSPGGYQEGLRRLLFARQEILVLHVACPEELEPEQRGPLTLVDVETGRKKDLEMNPWLLQRYRRTLESYCREIESFCRQRGINYLFYNSRQDPVDFLLEKAHLLFKRQ
ncbi:MAG TPA: DUF58 domain-containing protein [Bacillota bacterium]|jgi:uncharacterized protein (DUF58 family)|nr:DUF58 domain-containing protein [Bacillota bacterium]HOB86185.1 DUF58 domain-containing protein [Bacillota bacterium]HOP68146.1 DUF58 domain-containing protein [Bacillota bacterium]HPT33016.1 DUF58 domain-containing protein [Bacillota bacterium]HPZ64125.1 DUF58 domain-containing protein [Bacillota bacterium]